MIPLLKIVHSFSIDVRMEFGFQKYGISYRERDKVQSIAGIELLSRGLVKQIQTGGHKSFVYESSMVKEMRE